MGEREREGGREGGPWEGEVQTRGTDRLSHSQSATDSSKVNE